jgi:hypothetical protein
MGSASGMLAFSSSRRSAQARGPHAPKLPFRLGSSAGKRGNPRSKSDVVFSEEEEFFCFWGRRHSEQQLWFVCKSWACSPAPRVSARRLRLFSAFEISVAMGLLPQRAGGPGVDIHERPHKRSPPRSPSLSLLES